jgi:imidazolonepropionase-like amidohydrolase
MTGRSAEIECRYHSAARDVIVVALVLILHLAGCGGSATPSSETEPPTPPPPATGPLVSAFVAFIGVDVLPMDSEILLVDQTVIVKDRRIQTVDVRSNVALPPDAVQVDGTGLVLMPGLADMHVHLLEEDLTTYLAYGITTVRNMWGHAAISGMDENIRNGVLQGPFIYSTSPGIDGPPAKWPVTQIVETPAEATATVARLVGEGWTMLKVYQDLRPDVYHAVVEAAQAHDVPFMGHVPHRIGLREVLLAGQASLEHLGGYDVELGGVRGTAGWLQMDAARIPEVVMWTWESGAYVCPTLAVFKEIAATSSAENAAVIAGNRRTFVKALHDGYVPLLVGTDSGIDLVPPGSSLHEELSEFIQAGISPYATLAAATITPAKFLGKEEEFGAVREGLRADLLLLTGNPLAGINVLSDPAGIMVNGDWYSGDALETLSRRSGRF